MRLRGTRLQSGAGPRPIGGPTSSESAPCWGVRGSGAWPSAEPEGPAAACWPAASMASAPRRAAVGHSRRGPGPARGPARTEGAGPHRGAASDPRPRLTTPAPASAGPRFPTVPRKIQSGQSRKLGVAGSSHRQWPRTLRALTQDPNRDQTRTTRRFSGTLSSELLSAFQCYLKRCQCCL